MDKSPEKAVRETLEGLLKAEEGLDQALRIWETTNYVGLLARGSNGLTTNTDALKFVYQRMYGDEFEKEEDKPALTHVVTHGRFPSNAVKASNDEFNGFTVHLGQESQFSEANIRLANLNSLYALVALVTRPEDMT